MLKHLRERIKRSFVELTALAIALLVTSGVFLMFMGIYLKEIPYSTALVTIGSTFLSIGIIGVIFKSATMYLMQHIVIKESVERTVERMTYTYVPKLLIKNLVAHVTIQTEKKMKKSNIAKMVIDYHQTFVNKHPTTITQRKVTIFGLRKQQRHKLDFVDVYSKDKYFKLTQKDIDFTRYVEKNEETGEERVRYEYIVPLNPLGLEDEVRIHEKYEWIPCMASYPGQRDEFGIKLFFPSEKLRIEMEALDGFYFKSVKKKAIDWSGVELQTQSAPELFASSDGKIRKLVWDLFPVDLCHETYYEISFELGKDVKKD